jgi:predicted MPP superfamily phosphohydrolase
MRKKIAVPLGVAAAGLAGLGYAAGVEVNFYRLRRFELPVLEPGAQPLRILQVSDIHMVPGQRRKAKWLRSLAELEPDLVVNTGDNLSHPDAVGPVLDALEPLLRVPGSIRPSTCARATARTRRSASASRTTGRCCRRAWRSTAGSR